MRFIAFTIKCNACGKINRPDCSPEKSVYLVMIGAFRRCRHCGRTWEQITISARPLVRRYIHLKGPHIVTREYNGFPPRAIGFIIPVG